jgi:glycosyltransferase involved in cell wall biosynthesis
VTTTQTLPSWATAPERARGDVLVVVPAFNEEATVGRVAAQVRAMGYPTLVVDDGSLDRTADAAARSGATLLRLPVNLGVGGALRCGFRYAVTNGYRVVVQCDADGQHDPTQIPKLVEALERHDAQLVIGSRFAGAQPYRVTAARRIVMRRLARLASERTGTTITDATSGFRAIGGELLGTFAASYPSEYLGDTVESLVRAGQAGYRVVEIPVAMKERAAGVSSASTAGSLWFLVRVVAAIRLQRYRPTGRRVVRLTHWERA